MQAVIIFLDLLVRNLYFEEIKKLCGNLAIDDNLKELRLKEIKKIKDLSRKLSS